MIILKGLLRSAVQVGGGINRKTNEPIPLRSVIQVEDTDDRGLIVQHQLTVPDHLPFQALIGKEVALQVRPWASGSPVNFMYLGK